MNDISHIDTLPEAIDAPNYLDYKSLVWEAIHAIEDAGGDKWSNYNDSDPGRTILDILCFALLDLGYKANFPIAHILSDKKGNVRTKNSLYRASEILFTNPITLPDFRKLLIDRSDAIKNCWIEPIKREVFRGSLHTTYELCDELKITYISAKEDELSLKAKKSLKLDLKELHEGINGLLFQHRNLGDHFLKPKMLIPTRWDLTGKFYFSSGLDLEKEIAWVYYQLNNSWSTYIHFQSYEELKEQGKSVDQILSGPRLNNGFINDEDLKPLLQRFDFEKLKSELMNKAEISSIYSFDIQPNHTHKSSKGKGEIVSGTSPFFDYTRVAQTINDSSTLQFYDGNQLVRRIDQVKVNTYYNLLADRKAVSPLFEKELGPTVPKGRYRDLKSYHSLQYLFSQQFGLDVDRSFDGVPAKEKGRIKQLKAYLMLFEQLIADHQAQLENLGALMSFDSGVKVGEQLCKTYYSKELYDSPGARFILKAFDVYKKENGFLDRHPEKTWECFKKDPNNQYASFLENQKNNVDKNIDRKSKVLEHLLSRFGEKYDASCAPVLNPSYGNYKLAKVEIISSLLKNYPIYSENISRSYFQTSECEHHKHINLFSGIERRMELLFQLTAYYQEVIDLVRSKIKKEESQNQLDISTDRTKEGYMIVIRYQGEELLRMPFIRDTMHETIHFHLDVLQRICNETKGFVLIDHQLLLSNMQNCKWNVIRNGKVQKFSGNDGPKTEFITNRAIDLANKFSTVWKDNQVYLRLCQNRKRLKDYKEEAVRSDNPVFMPGASIFLPSWVSKLRDPAFLNLFKSKCLREGPVYLDFSFHRIPAVLMQDLLTVRRTWLEELHDVQNGSAGESVSKTHFGSLANNLLLDLILQSQNKSSE